MSQERACEAYFDELHELDLMFRRQQRGKEEENPNSDYNNSLRCLVPREKVGRSACIELFQPNRNHGTVTAAQKSQEHLPSMRVGHAPKRNKQSDRARYNLDCSFQLRREVEPRIRGAPIALAVICKAGWSYLLRA